MVRSLTWYSTCVNQWHLWVPPQKDTPREGWQQQSRQFLQAPSHGYGLHSHESLVVSVSTGCSDASCKLKYSCFTSSSLQQQHPEQTPCKWCTYHTDVVTVTREGKHWMTLTKALTTRELQIITTAQLSRGTHSRASSVLSQILHLLSPH